MKKFIEFLKHPLLHMVIGLLIYLWIGCGIWSLGDSFDSVSAFLGGFTVIAMSLFDYGLNSLFTSARPAV